MTTISRSKKGDVRGGKELPGKGYYPGITLEEKAFENTGLNINQ